MGEFYRVVTTREAQRELITLITAVAEKYGRGPATTVAQRLKAAVEQLGYMPTRFGPLPSAPQAKPPYRRAIVGPYRVIFSIHESDCRVDVERIDYASSDPRRLSGLRER